MFGNIEVDELVSLEALEDLAPEWATLWERAPRARTFQRPEWLIPWVRHLGPLDPWVLTLRRRGRLVGVVPLAHFRRGRERVLGLLGGGVSDSLDALLEPSCEAAAARALLAHLLRRRDRFDVCDLERLAPGSPLLALRPGPAWRDVVRAQDASPVLRLPRRVDELALLASPRLLRGLDAAWRRAARGGPVDVRTATAEDLSEALDALFRLRAARWARPPRASVLPDETARRFHAEVAAGLLRRGALRLHVLRLDGRIASVLYAFRERRRVAAYLSGFDPALRRLSPGGLVLRAAIEDAILSGASEFDLLAGRDAHKYRWGAEDEPLLRRALRLAEPARHTKAA
jgi:CelD/BcsL family acetyltransferase involved in cellulose biosynthesis